MNILHLLKTIVSIIVSCVSLNECHIENDKVMSSRPELVLQDPPVQPIRVTDTIHNICETYDQIRHALNYTRPYP